MMRLITSSKFQASLITTILTLAQLWYTLRGNASDDMKQATVIASILAVAAAWGISIHGTAKEDAAQKSAAATSPAVQVNTADSQSVSNPPASAPNANLAQLATLVAAQLSKAPPVRVDTPIKLPPLTKGP